MKRLSKAILIGVAALVVLVVAGLFSLNFYIASPGTQARVREALSKALGVPLVITTAGLTPWGGLRIEGAGIPTERGNFLEPTSFHARYRLLPLLSKRLEIYDIRAERPKIIWRQNPDGSWAFPQRPSAPDVPSEKRPAGEKKTRAFIVAIEALELHDGEITLLDKEEQPVASFRGVDLDVQTLTEERAQGVLKVADIRWGQLAFAEMSTPFRYSGETLALSDLSGKFANGTLHATLEAEPAKKDFPFNATLQIDGADLAQMLSTSSAKPGSFSGQLSGTLNARGVFRKIAKSEGQGRFSVADGRIQQLELLNTIGDVLRIPELADLKLRKAQSDYHLADERIYLDGLTLESPEVTITAKGPVRWNGKLDVETRLALSDRLAERLPDFVRTNFTTADAQGHRGLDFRVTGSLEKMKTDLVERVLGGKLGEQFEDILSSLLGPKKKKDDKKKKEKDKEKKKTPETDAAAPLPAPESATPPPPAGEP